VGLSGDRTRRANVECSYVINSLGVYPLAVYAPERHAPLRTLDLRVTAKTFATRQLRVAPGFVEPDAADLERIAKDATALEALFSRATARLWNGPFVAPVAARPTSNVGTRSIFNGQPRAPHAGVDFSRAAGAPVVAPGAGRIVLADDLFFTGKTVVIDHGLGLFSLLAHLSVVTVAQNEVVERGVLVGRVGATGRATGPYLHWSVRLHSARVDPLSLLLPPAREGPTRRVRPTVDPESLSTVLGMWGWRGSVAARSG